MPIVRFTEANLDSLLDADTDDAKAFTTYLGYWTCLATHINDRYGSDLAPGVLAALASRKPFRSLPGKGRISRPEDVRSQLLNGWTSELRLNLIDLEDEARLAIANHGTPIDAYYATTRHATAWLLARDGSAPTTHRRLLDAIASQVTTGTLYPPPWNLCCTALHPEPVYRGFERQPGECSNLAADADPDARAAMLLRTTRDRDLTKRIEDEKKRARLSRAPKGERKRRDGSLTATTIFDFAWRMRARSNYGDPAMYYVGSLSHVRARAFAASARTWTYATMFLFEALVAQRAPGVVAEAAVHFISRDRSGLAEKIVLSRLQVLDLLK
jgi:hypothetical protein